MGDRELVRAGDQIRVEMTRLRVEAMRSGRVMMLQAMTNGKTIRKQPYFSASDATEAIDQTGSQSALLSGADQGNVAVVQAEPESEEIIELAGDVMIAAVAVVATARAAEIEQLSMAQQAEGWSRPVLFYPDGRTSTASLTVTSESIGRIQVNI